jgi:hypothetical protein
MLPDKPLDCSTHVLRVGHQLIDQLGELEIYYRNQCLRSADARFFALQSLSFEVLELEEGQLGPARRPPCFRPSPRRPALPPFCRYLSMWGL